MKSGAVLNRSGDGKTDEKDLDTGLGEDLRFYCD
jgi:hypothetical protein